LAIVLSVFFLDIRIRITSFVYSNSSMWTPRRTRYLTLCYNNND
jgi:hypothetical protein